VDPYRANFERLSSQQPERMDVFGRCWFAIVHLFDHWVSLNFISL
jgi:hypothetical protein